MREQKSPYLWLTLTAILGIIITALSIAAAPFAFHDPLFPNLPSIAAFSGIAVGSVMMIVAMVLGIAYSKKSTGSPLIEQSQRRTEESNNNAREQTIDTTLNSTITPTPSASESKSTQNSTPVERTRTTTPTPDLKESHSQANNSPTETQSTTPTSTPHSSLHPPIRSSPDAKEKKKCLDTLKKYLKQTNKDGRTVCNNIIVAIRDFGANAYEISRILNTPDNKALIPVIIGHLQNKQKDLQRTQKTYRVINRLIWRLRIYEAKLPKKVVKPPTESKTSTTTSQIPKNYSEIRAAITSQPVKRNKSPTSLTLEKIPPSRVYDGRFLNAFKNQNNIAALTDELLTTLKKDSHYLISFFLINGLWDNQLSSFQINFIIEEGIKRKILKSHPPEIEEQIAIKKEMEQLLKDNNIDTFVTHIKKYGLTFAKLIDIIRNAYQQRTINESHVETICKRYCNILPPSEKDAGYWQPSRLEKERYLTLRGLIYKPPRVIEIASMQYEPKISTI